MLAVRSALSAQVNRLQGALLVSGCSRRSRLLWARFELTERVNMFHIGCAAMAFE